MSELAKRTWHEVQEDDCLGLAARMSYYFVLALFPFLIFLAAIVGYLPFTGLWDKVLDWITHSFPAESQRLVIDIVAGLTRQRTRFLSLGLLGTTWAASSGFVALIEALNRAYEVKETRGFWKLRATALLMLIVAALFFLSSFGLLTVGDWLGRWLEARISSSLPFHALWQIGRWLVSLALLEVGVSLIYYALPNVKQSWRWVTPGSLFVVLAWLPISFGFGFYVRNFGSYDKTYGSLGAFVILMVWVYITSFILLVGAELNSELEKASPHAHIRQGAK